jgi:hypothetical protein
MVDLLKEPSPNPLPKGEDFSFSLSPWERAGVRAYFFSLSR